MGAQKAFAGLLRGNQFLKEAVIYLKNPKKLSQLLTAVIVYAKKNRNAVKTFLKGILLLWKC
jgi:hypothetical protein